MEAEVVNMMAEIPTKMHTFQLFDMPLHEGMALLLVAEESTPSRKERHDSHLLERTLKLTELRKDTPQCHAIPKAVYPVATKLPYGTPLAMAPRQFATLPPHPSTDNNPQ
jgi:hypothetical protein